MPEIPVSGTKVLILTQCCEKIKIKATGKHETTINRTFVHDDVIKWRQFLRYWPFVWGIHRSPVNSPHKGQWRGALMFSLICALDKQSWCWWFETPSYSLWRHCTVYRMISPLWSKRQNELLWNHTALQNKEHSRTENQDANFVDTHAATKIELALGQLSVFSGVSYYIHRQHTKAETKRPPLCWWHFLEKMPVTIW